MLTRAAGGALREPARHAELVVGVVAGQKQQRVVGTDVVDADRALVDAAVGGSHGRETRILVLRVEPEHGAPVTLGLEAPLLLKAPAHLSSLLEPVGPRTRRWLRGNPHV